MHQILDHPAAGISARSIALKSVFEA